MGNIEYHTRQITNKTIQINQIDFYLDSLFTFIVGCEMVLFILVIYFLVEEAIEVKSMGLEYFKSFWNCLDLCVIGVSLDVCLYRICFQIAGMCKFQVHYLISET